MLLEQLLHQPSRGFGVAPSLDARTSVDHLTLGVVRHVDLFRDELDGDEGGLTLAARSDNGTDLQVLTSFVGSHLQYLYNDLQTRYDALRAAQEGKP